MVGRDFIFDNKRLSNFGFRMANPNEDDISGLTREIIKGEITSARSNPVHYGTKYINPLILPLFIIKDNCYTSESIIEPWELRNIQKWLTSPKKPEKFTMVANDGRHYEYCGIFTDISPYKYLGLNGINLKFTNDSPFVYEYKKVNISCEETLSKNLPCIIDDSNEYSYPIIYYYPTDKGEVTFKNKNNEDNAMSLTLKEKYNEVIIDCYLKRIIADGKPLTLSDVDFGVKHISDSNNIDTGIYKMNWIYLQDGKNDFDITGSGKFVIEYKNLLKLGGLVNV